MSRDSKFGKGRHPTKFSYTYEDLAGAIGCSVAAARKHAQRGNFDPKDILSVLEFVHDKLQKRTLSEDAPSFSELIREARIATGE